MPKSATSPKCVLLAASLILANILILTICAFTTDAAQNKAPEDAAWTIYYHPGVRFGTDERTLFINDFLIPFYQDDKRILFGDVKYTPTDVDSWEVNLGLGYRQLFLRDRLILGVNGFYDQRKTPWGSIYEQWGLGTEIMADVPMGKLDLGLTGRFNYYHPLTSAKIDVSFTDGNVFIFKGNGIYSTGGVLNARIEEPLLGFDGEAGIPILKCDCRSTFLQKWIFRS